MSPRPRACLFVEYLYPVVSRGLVPFAGGIEVQLALLGRGLARLGFDVSVVTCDFGQPDGLEVDGMRLIKAYPPQGGLRGLRFFHPRLTRGISALARADADVYVARGASLWSGIVRDVARWRGRKFVWLTGHDHDVQRELPDVLGVRDRTWARRAIRGADAIVTQTRWQQERLRADFGLDSTVIMNGVEIPPEDAVAPAGRGADIVWLSTYKPVKRPEWFTRFAERHPHVRCRMAGVIPVPPLTDAAYREALAVSERLSNLAVTGTVPHERIGEFLRGAGVFAHTSPSEGFPNVMLEAWAAGLPTVSSFDPDGIVERERLGACRETYEAWEAELERRAGDETLRREEGARARRYASARHAPEVVHEALAALLHRVTAGSRLG